MQEEVLKRKYVYLSREEDDMAKVLIAYEVDIGRTQAAAGLLAEKEGNQKHDNEIKQQGNGNANHVQW